MDKGNYWYRINSTCRSLCLAVVLFVSATAQPAVCQTDKQGYTPLFNGENLDGWVVIGPVKDAFTVEDGVLACTKAGGQWLRTTERYEDFILRLEYKISEGGNSGIFIRATRYGNPAYTGMEVQILDDAGKEPDVHSSGALYGSVAPKKNAAKPAGEWNEVEITCDGRRIAVVLNGELLYDIDINDYAVPLEGRTPLKERVRLGYIGLQDYGDPVWFRNIRIKVLD